MASDVRDFAKTLDRAAATAVAEPLLRAKQMLARQALERIVSRTPVATGRARANWQTTIGRPATGELPDRDPSGAAALARGAAAILGDRDPFATVWLTNNVPYIQRLEAGGARQAPAGMVALTVAELGRN